MKIKVRNYGVGLIFFVAMSFLASCGDGDNPGPDEPQEVIPKLMITSPEENSDIYLDGRFTGKVTPAKLGVSLGEHVIGVGQFSSENYLKKEIVVELSKDSIITVGMTNDDVQQAKIWKLLFVGINSVIGHTNTGAKDTLTYTKEELDLAFDYLKYSFKEYLEPYSYNTIKWEYDRHDIDNNLVWLDVKNLFPPQKFEKYITEWGINKGDYDLIVVFYRFEGDDDSTTDDDFNWFNGMAWYNKADNSIRSSYLMIRYYRDIQGWLDYMKAKDPGMFVHEWLHTVCETFYPGYGVPEPDPSMGGGSSLHAIEAYGYKWPWMDGYKDMMRGRMKEKSSNNSLNPKHESYVGMTPDDYLEHTVREAALEN